MPSNASSLQNSASKKRHHRHRKRKDKPYRNAFLTESAAWRVERLFTHLDRAETSTGEILASRDASPTDQRGSTSSIGQASLIASPFLFDVQSVSHVTSSADDRRSIRASSWHTDDSPQEWESDAIGVPSAFTLSRSGEVVTRPQSTTLGSALDTAINSNSLRPSSGGDMDAMSSSCPCSSSLDADLEDLATEPTRTEEEHRSQWDDILRQDAAEDGRQWDTIFCSFSPRKPSSSPNVTFL